MNWEAIGAIGEILGAAAVVATLIYLAKQLGQNTRALRSSSYDSYNETANALSDFQALHARELADIFDSGTPYMELATDQRLLLDSFSYHNFNTMEVTFLHHDAGTMDDAVFAGKVRAFRMAMGNSLAVEAWERHRMGHSDRFQRFMDEEVVANSGVGAPAMRKPTSV